MCQSFGLIEGVSEKHPETDLNQETDLRTNRLGSSCPFLKFVRQTPV